MQWLSCMARQLIALVLIGAFGCATTSTTERVWSRDEAGRTGNVESVRETVQRVQGDPGAGALFGAVIGGILFHGRPLGVVSGAAVGAAASQGSSEHHSYDVFVRFDDGRGLVFRYEDFVPFAPGTRVVLTQEGLQPL